MMIETSLVPYRIDTSVPIHYNSSTTTQTRGDCVQLFTSCSENTENVLCIIVVFCSSPRMCLRPSPVSTILCLRFVSLHFNSNIRIIIYVAAASKDWHTSFCNLKKQMSSKYSMRSDPIRSMHDDPCCCPSVLYCYYNYYFVFYRSPNKVLHSTAEVQI